MRRRTFDAIVTAAGLAIAVFLLAAAGMLAWGHGFVTHEVRTQLVAQKIFFPAADSPEVTSLPRADAVAMASYAGQEMTTGAQAQTWADHFIAVHLLKIGGGQTYAQLSGKAQADPKNAALAAQVQTVFRGETLRGMLLNAYGYWEIGQIMLWSAFIALGAAVLMALLSVAGIVHLRRTPAEAEVLPRLAAPVRARAV
ncbi:MAG TPA: hypothetical protein VFQ44_28575 [Streptosporangiaceae bacterium]|nr:hypothetical protein [Streptosporangiaceae bacterium]